VGGKVQVAMLYTPKRDVLRGENNSERQRVAKKNGTGGSKRGGGAVCG